MSHKMVNLIGWIASSMGLVMYFSYIDQIMRNLEGNKGSMMLAIATLTNCLAWFFYGALKPHKDWPIIICNAVGIFLSLITAITAF